MGQFKTFMSSNLYLKQGEKMKRKMVFQSLVLVMVLSLAMPAAVLAAPSNDNFVDAQLIGNLPFSVYHDTSGATFEADEPYPTCGSGAPLKTAWFAYTPASNMTLMPRVNYYYFPTLLAVYTGSSLADLSQVRCGLYYETASFQAQAGTTYYFQVAGLYGDEGTIPFSIDMAPPPQVNAYFYPSDPSVFDNVSFNASVYDPANIYGQTYAWTISDGTSSDQGGFYHQFASDGDYNVNLLVTTSDGRSNSSAQTIQVRTRDVSISKLSVPQMASTNQTKTINVEVKNNRYADYVQVALYKGLPGGGEQLIGTLMIYVPARATKPTVFKFTYTFTSADVSVGKVIFRATANLVNGRDALPSDNTSIMTTIVNR